MIEPEPPEGRLAWAIVIALFGESIVVMRGMNLLLHSANATLLFLLLLRLSDGTSTPFIGDRDGQTTRNLSYSCEPP